MVAPAIPWHNGSAGAALQRCAQRRQQAAAAVLPAGLDMCLRVDRHSGPKLVLQEAMFGEEEVGQPHSNKEAALLIAYEAVQVGAGRSSVGRRGQGWI
jgi:hypothetical protein